MTLLDGARAASQLEASCLVESALQGQPVIITTTFLAILGLVAADEGFQTSGTCGNEGGCPVRDTLWGMSEYLQRSQISPLRFTP
jgi:hypothetical protein